VFYRSLWKFETFLWATWYTYLRLSIKISQSLHLRIVVLYVADIATASILNLLQMWTQPMMWLPVLLLLLLLLLLLVLLLQKQQQQQPKVSCPNFSRFVTMVAWQTKDRQTTYYDISQTFEYKCDVWIFLDYVSKYHKVYILATSDISTFTKCLQMWTRPMMWLLVPLLLLLLLLVRLLLLLQKRQQQQMVSCPNVSRFITIVSWQTKDRQTTHDTIISYRSCIYGALITK